MPFEREVDAELADGGPNMALRNVLDQGDVDEVAVESSRSELLASIIGRFAARGEGALSVGLLALSIEFSAIREQNKTKLLLGLAQCC